MKSQIHLLKMATNLRLLIFVVLTGTVTISSAQNKQPMKCETIPEKVFKIKTLCGPSGADYIEYPETRRWAAIREIVAIGTSQTPDAVAALIDLVLHEELYEYDQGVEGDFVHHRVSHQAVKALLDQPLTELPIIPGSDLPDYPYISEPGLEHLEFPYRAYYRLAFEHAFRHCRDWCREIRDGTRSFQLQGSRHRYNHLGQIINHPPPRTHSTTSPPQTPGPASSQPSLNPKTYWLIALLTLLTLVIIGAIIKLTIRKT